MNRSPSSSSVALNTGPFSPARDTLTIFEFLNTEV
jgi:hypothetical protein